MQLDLSPVMIACRTVAFFSDAFCKSSILAAISLESTGNPNSLIISGCFQALPSSRLAGARDITPSSLCIRCMLLSSNLDTEIAGTSYPSLRIKYKRVMLSSPPTDTWQLAPSLAHVPIHSLTRILACSTFAAYGRFWRILKSIAF